MAKRKLSGAALAAHRRKVARGGKKKRKGSRKRKASKRGGLEARVSKLEHFATRQKHLNTVFRNSITSLYHHTSLRTPASVRQLPSGR